MPAIDPIKFYITAALLLIASFVLAVYLMPRWIRIIKKYNMLDLPDHRKHHKEPTPSMGGVIVIFTVVAFSILPSSVMPWSESLFLIISILGFAIIGFLDDWKDLNAKLKLGLQIAFATTAFAMGYRVDYLFNLVGIGELPLVVSYIITLGFYILIVNAYNLIDGVDALAGGLLLINFAAFGIMFFMLEAHGLVLFCAICIGAILGFLKYNYHPAKIFMGDSGSLPMGMIMGFFTLKVLQLIRGDVWVVSNENATLFISALLAINAIPLFDTIRVFAVRLSKKKSPFNADRTHLHHIFMKNRFGHRAVSSFIHAFHLGIIVITVYFGQHLKEELGLFFVVIISSAVFEVNTYFRLKNQRKKKNDLEKEALQYAKSNKLLYKK